jgi:serine/threonine protein kinase
MGALYLAITGDRGLERLTVIKTVLPHLADKEYVARFRDEAKVVVKLSHSNLIPVFDAGQVGGELFLAMDFVEGKDLRAVWNRCAKKQVAFPIDIAAYIVKELCRGLHYAHSFRDLELVHRDVSPPNVLISFEGEVKLTDFGLAASTLKLEKTAPGIIYGKVAYMSPEQARGETLDGRSDLYAGAIILWELLTGRQLFPPSKEQPKDLVNRAQDPQVPNPSAKAPRVPPELDAICVKALAARREDRYATGEELREALQGWLAKAAPTTDSTRLGQFLRELFAEDVEVDREARQQLIEKVRRKARLTLPPTDELRRLLEQQGAEQSGFGQGGKSGPAPHGTLPLMGRRAEDRGHERDRRRIDRRDGAVDVPAPGPGGQTVVRPDTASGALALSEHQADMPDEAPDHTEVLGSVIDGRYKVLELIGEGGMGRVFLAEHVEIGKRVAVKILHPVYGRMPELVERFRREARAASRIGHPHIVDVTDSGTTKDDQVYFVMEYLEGVELASVIDREGALNVTRCLRLSAQICRALSAAHAVGIIHRDLKPENVFLTVREGTSDFVKVLDFGIAKSAEAEEARAHRLTHPGMAMGTPEYMAPEQAAGRPADARTDVYAVGAILYEMLTGSPPYSGDNFMEILTKKATQDPAPIRNLRSDLPEAVVELVDRSMARDPDDRPPSMEAFEYELTKCLQGRGAAVAKILGMPVSAAGGEPLIGGARRRAASAPPLPPELLNRGRPVTARPLASELVSYDDVDDDEENAVGMQTATLPPFETAPHTTSLWSRMVWTLFGVAVVFGVGVIIYVALGEKTARDRPRTSVNAVTAPDAGNVAGAPDASPAVAVAPADGGHQAAVGDAGQVAPVGVQKPDREKPIKKPPDKGKDLLARKGPPRSKAEANELLREGAKAEAALEWSRARRLYERVAKGKYYRARGLLGIAKVAFETKQLDEAIKYARKALDAGGGNSARMQLGHAYFKKKDYQQAIKYYEAVLQRNPKSREAQQSLNEARKRAGQ